MGRVLWIMLNPSTADAFNDDATIRRCIGFSRTWGMDSLAVVNLFALRATKPSDLLEDPDPVGPGNDLAIMAEARRATRIIAAWGAWSEKCFPRRALEVAQLVSLPLYHIGLTVSGHPRHPLYVRQTARPTIWAPE